MSAAAAAAAFIVIIVTTVQEAPRHLENTQIKVRQRAKQAFAHIERTVGARGAAVDNLCRLRFPLVGDLDVLEAVLGHRVLIAVLLNVERNDVLVGRVVTTAGPFAHIVKGSATRSGTLGQRLLLRRCVVSVGPTQDAVLESAHHAAMP